MPCPSSNMSAVNAIIDSNSSSRGPLRPLVPNVRGRRWRNNFPHSASARPSPGLRQAGEAVHAVVAATREDLAPVP